MTDQKIYYRRARTFGQVFTESFGYIKQNFKSFYGALLAFSLPFIIIMVLLLSYVVSSGISTNFGRFGGTSVLGEMFGVFFIIIILVLLMQAVYVTVINQHIILNEELPPGEKVTLNDIGKTFFSSFWRVLGNCMLLAILSIVFFVIYALVNAAISAAFSTMGVGGILLAAILQFFASLIISPVIGYVFISSLMVVQRDKVGVITALSKVFRYLKGNFWHTWCIAVVAYIISYLSSIVVMIPAIIFFVLQVVSRVKYGGGDFDTEISSTTIIIGSIVFIITIALAMCVYALFFLMCNFQYTSLEEKKEGSSIIEKINQIQ